MPPFTHLALSASVYAGVVEHARRESPLECCGLLAGRVTGGVGTATARFEIRNDAASATEYETNARDMFAAFRAMRERDLELLAIYHSHPASSAVPSRRDIDRNTYGESVVHLIGGLGAAEPEVRAWWLEENGCREVPFLVAEI